MPSSSSPPPNPTPTSTITNRLAATLHTIVALVQFVLHFLGYLALLGALLTFLVGNTHRAGELFLGGVSFIVLKYVLGFIFVPIISFLSRAPEHQETPPPFSPPTDTFENRLRAYALIGEEITEEQAGMTWEQANELLETPVFPDH